MTHHLISLSEGSSLEQILPSFRLPSCCYISPRDMYAKAISKAPLFSEQEVLSLEEEKGAFRWGIGRAT